jgi:glyoxylase-like metal-dependent hydrolase (beta-lactamase superfamily II)
MTEEIAANIYKIEIPLPNSPLKFINSYVIRSPERNLIIDTGMNREECMNAMKAGLQELGVDLRKTDLFISHYHVDHLGLAPKLITARGCADQ